MCSRTCSPTRRARPPACQPRQPHALPSRAGGTACANTITNRYVRDHQLAGVEDFTRATQAAQVGHLVDEGRNHNQLVPPARLHGGARNFELALQEQVPRLNLALKVAGAGGRSVEPRRRRRRRVPLARSARKNAGFVESHVLDIGRVAAAEAGFAPPPRAPPRPAWRVRTHARSRKGVGQRQDALWLAVSRTHSRRARAYWPRSLPWASAPATGPVNGITTGGVGSIAVKAACTVAATKPISLRRAHRERRGP